MKYLIFLMLAVFGCGNQHSSNGLRSESPFPWLEVNNGQLENEGGGSAILHGVSTHGLQWFPKFANFNALKWLKDDWKISVIRAAMYTAPEAGGYIANHKIADRVYDLVDHAISLNLYAIIDWHNLSDGNPNKYRQESISFFESAAKRYGNSPNVISEICNEPNGNVSWNGDIRPYAVELIKTIREHAPRNIIIVGTSRWSQDVDVAAQNPIKESNIIYAVHFYAGTHRQGLRNKIDKATAKGIAIFVSEWGVSQATGTGGVYENESNEWLKYLDKKGISWVNWNLSDARETSALLMPGSDPNGGWSDKSLSRAGRYVRAQIIKNNKVDGGPTQISLIDSRINSNDQDQENDPGPDGGIVK